MVDDARHRHTLEVVNLTTREYGGQNLVLFGRSENEDDVCGRFFQRFQKSVESRSRQHVHLVDDENLVSSHLWRNASLVH